MKIELNDNAVTALYILAFLALILTGCEPESRPEPEPEPALRSESVVKDIILWAEMMGDCIPEATAITPNFNIEASAPSEGAPRHVVMSATASFDAVDETVDCLSDGLAQLGW